MSPCQLLYELRAASSAVYPFFEILWVGRVGAFTDDASVGTMYTTCCLALLQPCFNIHVVSF